MPYKLYELIDNNRGEIYQDFTDGEEIRKAWWGFQPYNPPNEPGFVNEEFISLVEKKDNFIMQRPIFHMFALAEEFNKALNNLSEYVNKAKDGKKFFKNLVELQNSLIELDHYDGNILLFEMKDKNKITEDGSSKFSTAITIGQDDFPVYNQNTTEPSIENNLDANSAMYCEDLEYNHVDDATEDEYELSEERKKAWIPGSKAVNVKKKCKLGGLGNTSAACNQGDISNLEFSSLNEIITLLNEVTEGGGYLAFHGSPTKIENFDDEHLGAEEATDQEGPGIYFTTSFDDALGYGSYVYTVRLSPRKLVDESSHEDISEQEIETLIKMSPHWEEDATNWAENPETGLHTAINSFIDYAENEKDLFQQIWYDFFRYYPKEFVRGMVKLGYDGQIIKKPNNISHIIVYNPNIIQIKDVEKVNPELNEIINEEIKTSKELLDYAKKFKSDEDLLRSGGFPIDLLDKAAHGFTEDSVKKMMPSDLKIKWSDDLENVKYEIEHSGLSDIDYAKKIDLSEPIDVVYENGQFYIDDGHHRYYAAKILNKQLNVNLEIKDNPINKLGDGLDYDDYHRELWKTANSINEIINEELMKLGENKIDTLQELPFKDEIQKMGGKIYSVGGAVRDEFIGAKSKDLDILVTGIPMDQLNQIMSKYGRVDAVGNSFGILKFKPPEGEEIDVALPRSEQPTGEGGHKGFNVQSDHNLPIQDDLKRRDFTINAIAKDINGQVIDPYNGMQDIQNKIIRLVNPQAFADDPLRMLRAVQFASRFGFTIEPKTLQLIKQNAERIKEIPSERILIELDKIVSKGDPYVGAFNLKNTGLFKHIFGQDAALYAGPMWKEVKTMAEFIYLLTSHVVQNPADFYRNELRGDINTYKELKGLEIGMQHQEDNPVTNRTTAYNIYKLSPKALKSKLLPRSVQRAAQEFETGRYPKTLGELDIDGNDLKRFGLEGPEIGNKLKSLLINVYADKVRNNKQELLNLLGYRPKENLNEGSYSDTKASLMRSKNISKEMKEKILKFLGGGSSYHEGGTVNGLKMPKVKGKTFDGVSMGADKNGFFVYTHRARSKSKESPDKIPQGDIDFIKSTG